MSELDQALGDISRIRQEMARSTQFRGYGPATLALTGGFALAAAAAQAAWVPEPAKRMPAYLTLWIGTAAVSATLAGVQMHTRSRRVHSGLSDEMMHQAVEQFLPALGAGVLLTVVLMWWVTAAAWMLPGLWQVIFSLGIFSSCRFLPRTMHAAGAWYLLSGLVCLALGDGRALAPWTMGLGFGAGQMLVAAVLLSSAREGEDEG